SARFVAEAGERFDAPQAKATPLTPQPDPQANPQPAQPDQTWTLTSRVLVLLAEDAQPDQALAGLAAQPSPGLRRLHTIDAGTVEAAAAIAEALQQVPGVEHAEVDHARPIVFRTPTDPFIADQWTFNNTVLPGADSRVAGAWALGYSGAGSVIGTIERSFSRDHPDLAPNFSAALSRPQTVVRNHATSVAGIAAAAGNNNLGGAGAAFGATLADHNFGSGFVSTIVDALTHEQLATSIKTNSWGYDATVGTYVDGVSPLIALAVEEAATLGRDGLGTIVIWSAGNGGSADRPEYDPLNNNRFSIPVGSVGDLDTRADYNERGTGHFFVAHSSGNQRNVFSTFRTDEYTQNFGGTSAAAPLAAGIVALVLEANPTLTRRDVVHILADSARRADQFSEAWSTNAAGTDINEDFGLGAIDAEAAVTLAASWTPVSPELQLSANATGLPITAPDNQPGTPATTTFTIDRDLRVEFAQLTVNIDAANRGDIALSLVSPGGTVVQLTTPHTNFTDDLTGFRFVSRFFWDEIGRGDWTLQLGDGRAGGNVTLLGATLELFGTDGRLCPADMNHDGMLDIDDFSAFVTSFFATDPWADTDRNGSLDIDDFSTFVQSFFDCS
ncbi:MAG: S8 family serine peptidase, partial [Planctomycetota bacterium]